MLTGVQPPTEMEDQMAENMQAQEAKWSQLGRAEFYDHP